MTLGHLGSPDPGTQLTDGAVVGGTAGQRGSVDPGKHGGRVGIVAGGGLTVVGHLGSPDPG